MQFGALIEPIYEPQELITIAQQVEQWGFSSFWYPDEKFFRDPYVGLTLVAHHTRRIDIGVCVTDPYSRHPIMTAQAIASLAEVAPGRTWLGLGAGGRGFNAMGINRERPAVALREAVGVIRGLLAGEMVDYRGQVIRLVERKLDFEPTQPAGIMIATGSGRLVQRLAGEIGDAAMLANYATPQVIKHGLARIEEGAKRADRTIDDFRLISRVDVAVHEDRILARKAVAPVVLSDFRSSFPAMPYLEDLPEFELSPEFLNLLKRKDYRTCSQYRDPEQSVSLVPDALIDNMSIAGTPQEVRDRIGAIVAMDVFDEIAIHPVACEDQNILENLSIVTKIIQPFISERR